MYNDEYKIEGFDQPLFEAMEAERRRQEEHIELIASENFASPRVLEAQGSSLTNKYAEGYPGRRYYGGQEFTDRIEDLARERAKSIFRAEHANVQPLSGSPMNQAVYHAYLSPGDTVLSMDMSHGGHLTHGAPDSQMGKIYYIVSNKKIEAFGFKPRYSLQFGISELIKGFQIIKKSEYANI